MKNWIRRRITGPLLAMLRQGVSPRRLALCVAIGIVIGNIPVLGVSTLLCVAIALLFRLNLPAIQLAQAAMAPSQLLLIIPFVRLGEWIMHSPPRPVSLATLWDFIVHALLAWSLVAPIAAWLLYRLLVPLFGRAA